MKNKKIDVRVNEEIYNAITELSEQCSKSRAEIVRLALSDSLDKFSNQRSYTKEEYHQLIDNIKDLANAINKIETHLIRIGTNINQLAKYSNAVKDDRYLYSNQQILIKHIEDMGIIKDYLHETMQGVWLRL